MLSDAEQNKYSISVVIPAYNAQRFISRAIQSILNQTLPASEIIVVDDGSSDSTVQKVREFGDKVVLIEQQNAGASSARNAGIKAASGEWIAFLDADDEWLPRRLELQVDVLKRNPHLLWCSGNFFRLNGETDTGRKDLDGQRFQRAKQAIGEKTYFNTFFEAFKSFAIGCTITIIIKKSFFESVGYFDPAFPRFNDYDMWFRLAYSQEPLGYVFEPLAKYHEYVEDSIISKHDSADHITRFVDKHIAISREHGLYPEFVSCASRTVSHYINVFIKRNDGASARYLLRKYFPILSKAFFARKYFRALNPVVANAIIFKLSIIKKRLTGKHGV